jgi:hypothetical protein
MNHEIRWNQEYPSVTVEDGAVSHKQTADRIDCHGLDGWAPSDQPHDDEAHAQTQYPPRSHMCCNDCLHECISLLAVGAHDHCPRQRTERRRAPARPRLHAVRGQLCVVSPTPRGRVVALRSPTSRRDVRRGWMFVASGPLDVGSLSMTPDSSRISGLQDSGTLPMLSVWLRVTCWM